MSHDPTGLDMVIDNTATNKARSMDPATSGAIKRPRSSTPTSSKGGGENRKKKAKKKKDRNNRQSSDAATPYESSTTASQEKLRHHKETATAEGHRMAQVLATMGTLEQSRFQAFKRSCFSADAVQAWVAACLQDRLYQHQSRSANGRGKGGTGTHTPARLADMVAVGQAAEIGLVVATAAKVYAQRLIADAIALQKAQQKQQQQQQQQQQHDKRNSTEAVTNAASATSQQSSVSPHNSKTSAVTATASLSSKTCWPSTVAVWTAVNERRRRGIDPGFFLHGASDSGGSNSSCSSSNMASARVTTLQHYDVRRHAALAAQEAYDVAAAAAAAAGTIEEQSNDLPVDSAATATTDSMDTGAKADNDMDVE